MAGKKRRKRRAHRARRAATTRSMARPRSTASAGSPQGLLAGAPSANAAALALTPRREPTKTGRASEQLALLDMPVFGRLGRIATALLPSRVFFAMGRPVSAFVCCVLQASLLGWVPAALWAFHAERRAADKQRGLAARLRPL